MPWVILVDRMGNMVRNPMKTGTWSTRNQIKASRINEMTGVDRKVTITGLNPASIFLLNPDKIPTIRAAPNDRTNPRIPLNKVDPKAGKKDGAPIILIRVANDSTGPGRICLDPVILAINSHTRMSTITTVPLMTRLFADESFIGNSTANSYRAEFIQN